MPNPDLEKLLNMLAPFAEDMLLKHGEFFPFGATMAPDGQIHPTAGYMGEEHPNSQEVANLLTGAFRQQAEKGEIRAAGMCTDVLTIMPDQTEKTDALCFKLEHENGEAITVRIPYKKGFLRKYKFGEMAAGRHDPEFFIPKTGAGGS
jgi:hypothetical protein